MYEEFYGLTAKPFRLNPDPGFLFGSDAHRRAMAYLRYGLDLGEGFVAITGEVGAGKTTLATVLLEELKQEMVVARSIVSTQIESDDLLRVAAASFGLETRGATKGELLVAIQAYLTQQLRDGKRTILIVDEVQNLSRGALEELRMLSNFVSGSKPLLQSLLLGQKEFLANLQQEGMEQIRQRIVAAHHLKPLLEDEIQPYIEHRLDLVGWKRDPLFKPDAVEVIFKATGGLPRQVNLICERALVVGYVEEVHEIGRELVTKVLQEHAHEFSAHGAKPSAAHSGVRNPPSTVTQLPGSAVVSDGERRLLALERKVESLEEKLAASQQKTQKLLMLMLLSDDTVDSSDAMKKLESFNKAL